MEADSVPEGGEGFPSQEAPRSQGLDTIVCVLYREDKEETN